MDVYLLAAARALCSSSAVARASSLSCSACWTRRRRGCSFARTASVFVVAARSLAVSAWHSLCCAHSSDFTCPVTKYH